MTRPGRHTSRPGGPCKICSQFKARQDGHQIGRKPEAVEQNEPGQIYQELLDLEKERRRKKRL
eukprot:10768562-Heterocapsa_arctica.AAC.1